MPAENGHGAALAGALELHRAGRLAEARRAYEAVIAADANAAEAWHLLGILAYQEGDNGRSVACIDRAVQLVGDDARYFQNRGNAHLAAGNVATATADFEAVCRLTPNDPEGHYGLGLCRLRAGDADGAVRNFQTAVERAPAFTDAHLNLGMIFERKGDDSNAMRHLAVALDAMPANLPGWLALARAQVRTGADVASTVERARALAARQPKVLHEIGAIALRGGALAAAVGTLDMALAASPNDAASHMERGNALFLMGRTEEAVQSLESALRADPDLAQAAYSLSAALMRQGRFEEAGKRIDQALARSPNDAYGYRVKAAFERRRGDEMAARDAYGRAAILDPGNIAARWGHAFSLPHIYESEQHLEDERGRWLASLAEIEDSLDLSTPARVAAHIEAVRNYSPFTLHYQGHNDREVQRRFAAIVRKIAHAAHPEFADYAGKPRGGTRPRVGFVSANLHWHTVFVLFKSWIYGLNDGDFEPFVFYTGSRRDHAIGELAAAIPNFRSGFRSDADLFTAMRDAALDVVIYPDIGMDPPTQLHAAFRFAPRQYMSWGHPVTSGMPAIDGFLSSDAMEPEDGDEHYTEPLIRLPNLSVDVAFPTEAAGIDGRQAGSAILCPQSLFKLLPSFDDLVVEIAKRVPGAQFRFIKLPEEPINRAFQDRLSGAFRRAGLEFADRVTMLPRLGRDAFFKEIASARLLLDPPSWSGGRTSLEAFACRRPIVTAPGRFMRGRHTAGMYKRMGLSELICRDAAQYVARAAAWMSDSPETLDDFQRIAGATETLFADRAGMDALRKLIKSN